MSIKRLVFLLLVCIGNTGCVSLYSTSMHASSDIPGLAYSICKSRVENTATRKCGLGQEFQVISNVSKGNKHSLLTRESCSYEITCDGK